MNILKLVCDCVIYLHGLFFDFVEFSLRKMHEINYPDDHIEDDEMYLEINKIE
jgi:hypothetical protein